MDLIGDLLLHLRGFECRPCLGCDMNIWSQKNDLWVLMLLAGCHCSFHVAPLIKENIYVYCISPIHAVLNCTSWLLVSNIWRKILHCPQHWTKVWRTKQLVNNSSLRWQMNVCNSPTTLQNSTLICLIEALWPHMSSAIMVHQHKFRSWLVASRHQATTWTIVDLQQIVKKCKYRILFLPKTILPVNGQIFASDNAPGKVPPSLINTWSYNVVDWTVHEKI